MGKRFRFNGDEVEVPDGMTAGELKEMDDSASSEDKVTFTDPNSGDSVILSDDDPVDEIPEGENASTMPVEGGLYG